MCVPGFQGWHGPALVQKAPDKEFIDKRNIRVDEKPKYFNQGISEPLPGSASQHSKCSLASHAISANRAPYSSSWCNWSPLIFFKEKKVPYPIIVRKQLLMVPSRYSVRIVSVYFFRACIRSENNHIRYSLASKAAPVKRYCKFFRYSRKIHRFYRAWSHSIKEAGWKKITLMAL